MEMPKKRLFGKTAIITGAISGIGKSIALLFASQGCNLVITDRREESLKEVKKIFLIKMDEIK